MPILTQPIDDALLEFNPNHEPAGSPRGGGRFARTAGGAAGAGPPHSAGSVASRVGDLPYTRPAPKRYTRPKVYRVKTVEDAIPLVLAGKVVELDDTKQVHTLLEKLADMAHEAADLGEDAPKYDLCKVTVRGTNLFCFGRLKSAEHPEGVQRIHMPQFSGVPRAGSAAAKLPKNKNGNVNGAEAFIAHLKTLGIKVTKQDVPAAQLKASQAELVGSKVAAMMTARSYDPHGEPIFTSRDEYVLDGHHRWAAVVGRDAEDGKLGDSVMKTYTVDAPMTELLFIAQKWTKEFGIESKGA